MLYNPCSRWEDYEASHGCYFVSGLLAGAGSLLGGVLGFAGSTSAADTAAQAQANQLAFQQGVYNQAQGMLAPYYTAGTGALNALQGAVGTPTAPGTLTMPAQTYGTTYLGYPNALPPTYQMPNFTLDQFLASPGNEWELQQGLDAITKSGAPRTGAFSGNTLQALQRYGTGLASQDWWSWLTNQQNLYNTEYNAQNQQYWAEQAAAQQAQNNIWNKFLQLSNYGQSAATLTGPQTSLVNSIGNTMAGIGATNAAGTLGGYSAIASAFNPTATGQSPFSQIGNAITNFNRGGTTYPGSVDPIALAQAQGINVQY